MVFPTIRDSHNNVQHRSHFSNILCERALLLHRLSSTARFPLAGQVSRLAALRHLSPIPRNTGKIFVESSTAGRSLLIMTITLYYTPISTRPTITNSTLCVRDTAMCAIHPLQALLETRRGIVCPLERIHS